MTGVPATVVIVGSSVGGVRTAQALRGEGFEGRIVLVGEEARLPYDKPPLSKQFLGGSWDADRVALLTEAAADAARIELKLGVAAQRLDVAHRQVVLADGERLDYDAVVIATGAAARPSPWAARSGVHVLRTMGDSESLRADLQRDGHVVVVGGGFIGAEVAATARSLGREVTVVDPLPSPIGRVVGAEVGAHFAELHPRHGVVTRFGTGVESVEGEAGALRIQLTDGTELRASTVVVGIGATPNDGWLADSGLLVENGVVCDEFCRAVDAPMVHAVGDVARWFHPDRGEHTRVEHWTNAVDQATCVAHNIAHPDDLHSYRPVEYVWSDQYEWKIQIAGRPSVGAEHQLIGDPAADKPRFAVLYRGGDERLSAAVTVNWPKALVTCRRLLAAGGTFSDATTRVDALAAATARTAPTAAPS